MNLTVSNVECGYGDKNVVKNVSFRLRSGEVLCLLGPNGVGKTTFFKTLLGFLEPQGGEILIDGVNIKNLSRKILAGKMAYVPQAYKMAFAFRVIDVVLMGRIARGHSFAGPVQADRRIACQALEELGISWLENKLYTEISGGERQMVLIARALAQEAELLIMDEPTSNLDYGNQLKVLNQVKKLSRSGRGIIMTTHSPDHAYLCGSRVVVFHKGILAKIGSPAEVVTEELLKNVYDVDIRIQSFRNTKVCVPTLVDEETACCAAGSH